MPNEPVDEQPAKERLYTAHCSICTWRPQTQTIKNFITMRHWAKRHAEGEKHEVTIFEVGREVEKIAPPMKESKP